MNRVMNRWSLVCLVILMSSTLSSKSASAQAGLRESLERLDRNQNGMIDPDEVTTLARPYLERITAARRMSLQRSNRIDQLQEAARVYYALQNGVAGERIRPEGENKIKEFGPQGDDLIVPEFGLSEYKYPYIQDDLDEADETLERGDRNRDGFIDRTEARRVPWTHYNPFDDDLDGDDRLSRLELSQRYARRRLLAGMSDELVRKARRTGNGIRPSIESNQQRSDQSQYYRRSSSRYYLTATVLSRFDKNKNGRLEANEATSLGIPFGRIDTNRDGELSRDELQAHFAALQDEAGGLDEGLPSWYFELDANRDRQISLTEFSPELTEDKLAEFTALDLNSDGLLEASEIVAASSIVGGSYANEDAEILAPRKSVISEIEVSEDYVIGDLNVMLSITHTYASHLDAFLTGPDGQRIELFTAVGGSDDHFDQTIFDDQSRYPIIKSRPPFRGTFQPEGLSKKQPGLSHFNGKSIKGVWQLVIRGTRSDRFGMLHKWSLIVKPADEMDNAVASAPAQDGPQQTSSGRTEGSAWAAKGVKIVETGSLSVPVLKIQEQQEQEVRAKMDARKQAIERYRAYMEKMKSEGKEIPKEKVEYFKRTLREEKDKAKSERSESRTR